MFLFRTLLHIKLNITVEIWVHALLNDVTADYDSFNYFPNISLQEEFEDTTGNVFNKKTYDDLKRQGLLQSEIAAKIYIAHMDSPSTGHKDFKLQHLDLTFELKGGGVVGVDEIFLFYIFIHEFVLQF